MQAYRCQQLPRFVRSFGQYAVTPAGCLRSLKCSHYRRASLSNRFSLCCRAGGSLEQSIGSPGASPDYTIHNQAHTENPLQQLVISWGSASIACLALGLALCQGKAHAAAGRPPTSRLPPVHTSQQPRSAVAASRALPLASISGPLQLHAPALTWEALQYKLMQVFAMPAVGKIGLLIAVIVPIILTGAMLYRKASGATWQQALTRAYSLIIGCPSSECSVESQQGWAADAVLQCLFWAGLLMFATLLGIVAEDISRKAEQVRHGNHPVVEVGHTVVVNWSRQTIPLLQQMMLAHAEYEGEVLKGPFVVLADRDKEEMDNEVAGELSTSGPQVLVRAGNPTKMQELHRAAAGAAGTVVVLWPEHIADPAEACAQQAAVLSALKASGGVSNGQRVVLQTAGKAVSDYDAVKAALRSSKLLSEQHVARLTTSGAERINQLMAQVANQPGLDDVLADLLDFDEEGQQGAEFYVNPCPQHLEGRIYQHVRRCFDKAILVGIVLPSNQLVLNPHDSTRVPAGSQLVFVASCAADEISTKEPYSVTRLKLSGRKSRQQSPRNITVLCFDPEAAPSAIKSIAEFSSRGTHITLICSSVDEALMKQLKHPGVKVSIVNRHPNSNSALASPQARLEVADAVVLCGLAGKEAAAADSQVVSSVLQLQALAVQHQSRQQPLPIIASINSPDTEGVLWHAVLSQHSELKAEAATRAAAIVAAQYAKKQQPQNGSTSESSTTQQAAADAAAAAVGAKAAALVTPPVSLHLLQPDELLSGMLAQSACAPQLARVFTELFTEQSGHELYLRQPRESYGLPLNVPLCWKDVAEVVRARNETAVGIITEAGAMSGDEVAAALAAAKQPGSHDTEQREGYYWPQVQLGLPAAESVVLGPRDKLVVIALDA